MRLWTFATPALLLVTTYAQQPIGAVSLADASVANSPGGIVSTSGGRATLIGGALVTAHDRPATVALSRGGDLRVCQGTGVHLSESPDQSLLVAIDRGAFEIHTKVRPGDVVLTPDLRFTLAEPATLDLQMRVTPAGDTCVDNRNDHRGGSAPTLSIADAFGDATYQLKPGQHVTFEHGSLREVVDHETVPCGCPPDDLVEGSLADAMVSGGAKPLTPAEKAAAAHPFPAAVSDGLVPPAPLPPESPNQTHTQVSTTLTYDPSAPHPPALTAPTPTAPPKPAKQPAGNPLAAIGRFFKRLFAR
jgi:hypothetical protein